MATKYSSDVRPSLMSWNQSLDTSSYISTSSMSERPESPTLPMDGSASDEDYFYPSSLPSNTTRSTLTSSRRPSASSNTPHSSTPVDSSSGYSSPVRQLSSPVDVSQRRHIHHQANSISPSTSFHQYPSPPIAAATTSALGQSTPTMIANQPKPTTNGRHKQPTSPAMTTRSTNTSHYHKPPPPTNGNLTTSSSSTTSSSKRPVPKLTDYAAAAIELSSSAGSHNAPAPAAGMYWSRTITYGRAPSRPLRAHSANMVGEMMYVFGGCNQKTCFNQLYILDMDTLTWSKPHTFGQCPPPLRAHSCNVVEYTTGKQKSYALYVFGGGDGPNYFNDLYVLDVETLTWTKPRIEGVPSSPRRAHVTCLWQDKIIIVGGGNGTQALADVHVLDVSDPNRLTWSQMVPEGPAPLARGYHTGNLIKDKLVIYGGSDGHDCFSDVHILNLTTNRWCQIELDQTIPRLSHTATQIGSYLFIIGGYDGSQYSNEVLLLNLVTMTCETKKIYGTPPGPRGYHTAVLHDSRLYLLGGYDGSHVFDDLHTLELSSHAYLTQITNFDIDV